MSNSDNHFENPFPATAVTMFGVRSEFVAKFAYMTKARQHIVDYLSQYPKQGSALALSGGHGSGKTFLLNWLTTEISSIKNVRSQTVYAKADNDSVIDVYKQFMRSVTRSTLIDVTRAAIHNIGRNIAAAAQATQETLDKIQSSGTVQPALEEKIFDTNELYLLLKMELHKIGVSPAVSGQVAYAIGILEHPDFGEAAFSWLLGSTSQLPKETPLQSPLWSNDSTDAADVAVSALECIAGLYRLAEIALILILDQMENFLPAGSLTPTHASLLKKLVEQISAQGALLLMAGTPVAWNSLPRDVGPRLINRAPIMIGSLNAQETNLLIAAYLRGRRGFASEAVATIRDLSGGNPREILRISYEVFARTDGDFQAANDDILIQAAQESGTLADRATLALKMIDEVAERLSLSHSPANTTDGQKIDRLVTSTEGRRLAIVLITSPDARSEAENARKLTHLREQIELESKQSELLAVTVGFSSARVREVVEKIAGIMEFDESTFRTRLEQEFQNRLIASDRQSERDPSELFGTLLERITRLDEQLATIQATRTENEREVSKALQRGTAELAETERAEIEAKTRHELRFALDELHEALRTEDINHERSVLRRLLVSNEANVKDATFDYLGSIYLDALDSLQLQELNLNQPISRKYFLLRSDLIRTMRSQLSIRRSLFLDLRSPLIKSVPFGIAAAIYAGAVIISSFPFRSLFEAVALAALVGVVVSGVSFVIFEAFARPERKYRAFAKRLDELRPKM